MHPLVAIAIVAAAASAFAWVASLVTRDTSWVDRLWSIVPVVYVWIFAVSALASGVDAARLLLIAVLVTAWGARLTYNFARKGGYSGVEDYRWAVVRSWMKPWQFQLFNLFFIVMYQNLLLVLITLPAYAAWLHPSSLSVWDVLLAVLFVAFLTGETVADQQQWRFHQAKRRAGGRLEPGFLAAGMFRYSRHPNFFCEQGQWWTVYLFSVSAGAGWLNASGIGALLLTLLFLGSIVLTESISAGKYPAYADYRRGTSVLVPWPPRRQTPSLSPDSRR